MSEPKVDDRGRSKDVLTDYADWPLPGTADQDVYLGRGATATRGRPRAQRGGGAPTRCTWTDANSSETNYINTPSGSQTNRLVFLSPVLTHDLRVSGTPVVDLLASLSKTQTQPRAFLVDYGAATYVTRTGDGISTPTRTADLLGRGDPTDDRVLQGDHEAHDDRHDLARHEGHAGLVEPRLAARPRRRRDRRRRTRSGGRCCRTTSRSRPGTRSASSSARTSPPTGARTGRPRPRSPPTRSSRR